MSAAPHRPAGRVLQDLDLRLLRRLRQTDSRLVYPGALAGELGASTTQVQEAIARLSQVGFVFHSEPHRGIRLADWPDGLVPDQIEWHLDTQLVGRQIHVWNSTSSTNDRAWEHAGDRTFDGAVFLAETQTAGRGRRGARWVCPPRSSILGSVLLFPREQDDVVPWLTTLSVVSAVTTVRDVTRLDARVKWPNDICIGGRKAGGVLVESRHGQAAVLGIGLNVNIQADQFPTELHETATSLAVELGRRLDRSGLTRRLIREVDRAYAKVAAEGTAWLWQRWQHLAGIVGHRVAVSHSNTASEGTVIETSADGPGLVIQPESGERFCVHPARLTQVW